MSSLLKKTLSGIANQYNNLKFLRHPDFSRKSANYHPSRIEQLIYMRDLRLWVCENIPHSKSKTNKYIGVEKLQQQINLYEIHSKIITIY